VAGPSGPTATSGKTSIAEKIALFPGVTQVFEPEPALEPDLEKTAQQQADLLGLWSGLAGELKRRCPTERSAF
jgi:hypothetical protein